MNENLQGVKNIIFDFGGVILNIDYHRTDAAFRTLGLQDFDKHYSQMKQSELFDQLETGILREDDFLDEIKKLMPAAVDKQQIVDAWNAMLLDLPKKRLELLQTLKNHYKTFLLSNTNAIHEKRFNQILKHVSGASSMSAYFDDVYYSHKVNMRKPNADIFEKILSDHHLVADETLFIDDSPQHIAAASRLGLRTIYLEHGKTIEKDVFDEETRSIGDI